MSDKVEIVKECMIEIQECTINKYKKPMIITVNELSEKIRYNFTAKAYDIIYGLEPDDLDTFEIIRILNSNNMTYSYRGEIKNSSKILLFGAYI